MNQITDPQSLGEYMRNIREGKGWTLRQAEKKTGMKAMTIGSYERAQRHPGVPALLRWVDAMGVRLTVLGDDDVVVRGSSAHSMVEWFVVDDGHIVTCADRDAAEQIWEQAPNARVAFRTHVYGGLTLAGGGE